MTGKTPQGKWKKKKKNGESEQWGRSVGEKAKRKRIRRRGGAESSRALSLSRPALSLSHPDSKARLNPVDDHMKKVMFFFIIIVLIIIY